jgi:hypothetical protein
VDVDVDGVADVDDHGHDAERDAVAGHGAVAEDDVGHVDDLRRAARARRTSIPPPYEGGIQLVAKLCR